MLNNACTTTDKKWNASFRMNLFNKTIFVVYLVIFIYKKNNSPTRTISSIYTCFPFFNLCVHVSFKHSYVWYVISKQEILQNQKWVMDIFNIPDKQTEFDLPYLY